MSSTATSAIRAAAFALQRLGREVWPIHTVQFSSHAGYPGWQGRAFDAAMIDDCVAGLAGDRGAEDVRGAADGLSRQARDRRGGAASAAKTARGHRPSAVYACDPVIGDDGRGVYVGAGVARIFSRTRARLQRDIMSPTRSNSAGSRASSRTGSTPRVPRSPRCARAGRRSILVTSLCLEDTPADALDMRRLATREGLWRLRTPRLPIAVNGAGDLISALFLAHWLGRARAPARACQRRRQRLRRRRGDRGARRTRTRIDRGAGRIRRARRGFSAPRSFDEGAPTCAAPISPSTCSPTRRSPAIRSRSCSTARASTTRAMQRIAREFNLSETVFVREPRNPVNTAAVRIFTPDARAAVRRPSDGRDRGAARASARARPARKRGSAHRAGGEGRRRRLRRAPSPRRGDGGLFHICRGCPSGSARRRPTLRSPRISASPNRGHRLRRASSRS